MTTKSQTREQTVQALYAQYCEAHEASMAQFAPTRLDYAAATAVENAIVSAKLQPVTRSSKIMQPGTRLDISGVYVVDGTVYDFCKYREHGGFARIRCDKYDTLESYRNFSRPLPRYMWHE